MSGDPDATATGGGTRYRVEAAARALALLDAFADGLPEQTLTELAAATDIPRPTVLRLLRTMEERGYVERRGSAYALGSKLFALGNIAGADFDLRTMARPHLVALRDDTGETVQIASLDDWQVIYLERVLSEQPVAYMKSRAGAVLPAYCTGLGKVLLASRPIEDVETWSRHQHFEPLTPSTITTPEELLAELAAIRARGYAVDRQERELGVTCVAAPVYDHRGAVVAALSTAGPVERMPRELTGSETAKRVVAAALALSRDLGYRDSSP